MSTWTEKIDLRIHLLQDLKTNTKKIFEAAALMEDSLRNGHKILIFGNGGSSSQSSHFAAELVNKFYFPRPALPAIALTTDTACLTSIANDMDFKYIFSRQVEALGKPGDIAFGLTTSGKSPNVIEALRSAKQLKMKTMVLCGETTLHLDTDELDIDVIIPVPATDTPMIQEIHLFFLHALAELLEEKIFPGDQ